MQNGEGVSWLWLLPLCRIVNAQGVAWGVVGTFQFGERKEKVGNWQSTLLFGPLKI